MKHIQMDKWIVQIKYGCYKCNWFLWVDGWMQIKNKEMKWIKTHKWGVWKAENVRCRNRSRWHSRCATCRQPLASPKWRSRCAKLRWKLCCLSDRLRCARALFTRGRRLLVRYYIRTKTHSFRNMWIRNSCK